jgi:hypothetical protein
MAAASRAELVNEHFTLKSNFMTNIINREIKALFESNETNGAKQKAHQGKTEYSNKTNASTKEKIPTTNDSI